MTEPDEVMRKTLMIASPQTVGVLEGAGGGFIDVESSDGPCQLQFQEPDIATLTAALALGARQISQERARLGLPAIERILVKKIDRIEIAVDHLRQAAVLRTRFQDQSTQDIALARDQIGPTIETLQKILRSLEAQDQTSRQ